MTTWNTTTKLSAGRPSAPMMERRSGLPRLSIEHLLLSSLVALMLLATMTDTGARVAGSMFGLPTTSTVR